MSETDLMINDWVLYHASGYNSDDTHWEEDVLARVERLPDLRIAWKNVSGWSAEYDEIENEKGETEFMSYVHAMVVEKTDRATLEPIIGQFIVEGTTVFTDELNAYNRVGDMGYTHRICNHGALQFVCEDDGSVYTNNIEGFWSHFRRMITGCYHDVSDEHLQSYIDEACFR